MAKLTIHIIICFVMTFLWSNTVAGIDDFEDGDHSLDWFLSNGTEVKVPYLDENNNFQREITLKVTVDANHYWDHCRDKDDTLYNHLHIFDDYNDMGLQDEGDDYWDYMFQEGEHTDREPNSHCTVVRNCFSYALEEFLRNGVYKHWMDSWTHIKNAFNADGDPIDKTNVASCDVLLYVEILGPLGKPYHATGVDDVNSSANKPNALRWKFGSGGIYTLDRTTFETPKCDDTSDTEVEPLGGNWDWDAAGDESDLYPSGEVWAPE